MTATTGSRRDMEGKLSMQSKNIRQWSAHSDAQTKKVAAAIEKKRKENELLKEQIENLQQSLNMTRSLELGNEITSLTEVHDALIIEMDQKRRKLYELQQNTKFLDDKIMDARIDMGGINIAKENTTLINRQIKVLEDRLDKALVKFNEIVADNKNLREKIENLRQERIVFDNIYKKMERELHDKKKEMARTIEESNEAYEERDKINSQIRSLKVKRREELIKFEEQFKELDKIIHRDNEINEKIKMKEKERLEQQTLGGLPMDEHSRLKRKNNQGNWGLTNQKSKHIFISEKVKEYDDSFKKIETATGTSVEELIEKFSIAEDNNFSLFTYVNELNTEIEKLEEQISELDDELSRYKGDGAASEMQKKQQLEDLQKAVIAAEELTQEYQSKHKKTGRTLQELCDIVHNSFVTLGCDGDALTELLGTTGVTESNIMVYLGIIEQRTNELLQKRSLKLGEVDANSAAIVVGPQHKLGSVRLQIDAPSTGGGEHDDNDSEDEEKPLTREELAKRAVQSRR